MFPSKSLVIITAFMSVQSTHSFHNCHLARVLRQHQVRNHPFSQRHRCVHLSGRTALESSFRASSSSSSSSSVSSKTLVRPPNPHNLLSSVQIQEYADQLAEWMQRYNHNIVVITGAGLSTESGIPDYRGHTGSYHEGHKPVLHDQFISSHRHRQRYWGRSMFGWDRFINRQPNQGHVALSLLEKKGLIGVTIPDQLDYHEIEENFYFGNSLQSLSIITQNVDRLHHKAGSRDVIELHGRSDRVVCMHCGAFHDRDEYQQMLRLENHEWFVEQELQRQAHSMRPDGDAELQTSDFNLVVVPPCPTCQTGFLKPDVVFFGDSVPKHRVALCRDAVAVADAVLVIGSSLAVHSANRHVVAAHQAGKGIAVLNVGPTRADQLEGVLSLAAPAGPTLSAVAERLQ